MSVYFVKSKGWRYDFTRKGNRHTEAWFKTKRDALRAEAKKKEELNNPLPEEAAATDMGFFDLVNLRLDHVQAYNSAGHYRECKYMARRWVKMWGNIACGEITTSMIEQFLFERSKVSTITANNELRYLRAFFNFGIKKKEISSNPTQGIDFFPEEKRVKYIPPVQDIDKVIAIADRDTQDYLWVIRETLGRVSEINRLTWNDVDLDKRYVTLYTRKKKGGHLTPRKIWMTEKLYSVLSQRHQSRTNDHPWVFWHRYYSAKEGCWVEGPYKDRKKFMKSLCEKAGVRYFRFHALRHAGASLMDNINTPIGAIQKILGHENRKTTEIYLHSFDKTEKDAFREYEAARKSLTQSLTQKA